jgi:mono/diheme cytochrome c family protein
MKISRLKLSNLRSLPVALIALSAAPSSAAPAAAASASGSGVEFFERRVRPVLVQHCYSCHSASAEKLKGDFLADSRAGMLKGGESGPAIVPGKPDKSLLVKMIRWADGESKMPPKAQLPEQAIADLTKWVEMGAPWPAESKLAGAKGAQSQEERWAELKRDHWAWQPVKTVTPPAVNDAAWPKTDLDKFVLAKLESAGLKPVADADKVSLIRRVTFDLTGLPPTPEEVSAFYADSSPNAYGKLVDRLLASPAFGERWGRHWLDVARYAESTGSTRNFPYHHAWRYRNYVIDSFNADKPYNVFIQEQIAGDLMPAKDAAQKNERLVATGLLAMGVKDLNERDQVKFVMDNVDEQIDTVTRSILATTAACARCHDHKFDPISTEDYYRLAGVFRSTDMMSGVKSRRGGQNRDYADPASLLRLADVSTPAAQAAAPAASTPSKEQQIATVNKQIADLQEEIRKMRAQLGVDANEKANAKQLAKQNPAKAQRFLAMRQEMQSLRAELARLENAPAPAAGGKKAAKADAQPEGPLAMGARDEAKPADCRINIKGDHDNLGAVVPRGGYIPLVRGPATPAIPSDQSGRLQLAQWMSSPENPLTARVMVNRIWHHLFGQGIVTTVDNFGSTGAVPSHPELLDYMARQLVANGWSVKKTIRQIVLSRTYRLGASYNAANYAVDPANVLLWRHAQRRLDAEQLRDAMLVIGGNLESARPAASPVAKLPEVEIRPGRRGGEFDRGGEHRSVYLPVVRGLVVPMMETFDVAEPTMVTGARDVTTVATQALFLMNNDFAIGQAKKLADRVNADISSGTDAQRIDRAYAYTLGRSPTAAERTRALGFVETFGGSEGDGLAALCQALMASAEFRYLN